MPSLPLSLDITGLMHYGGLFFLFLVVFASTGIFFCFFIPTGAILFAAGLLAATGDLPHNIYTVSSLLILASASGNTLGYWFGMKTGALLYRRKESYFFRKKHLAAAGIFYKKYGGMAVTAGFLLPILRSFVPVIAGIVRIKAGRFILFTMLGSVASILIFAGTGYLAGNMPFIKPCLPYFATGFIIVVTIPLVARIIKEFRKNRQENMDNGEGKYRE